MKILFLGDIVGGRGRRCIARLLPVLRAEHAIDVVLANAENAAGGLGATSAVLDELFKMGIHGISLGNHTWRKRELVSTLDRYDNVVRPANYPAGVPGKGAVILSLPDGRQVGLVNVLGRVFVEPFACPFRTAREIVDDLRKFVPVIIVDFHAEATSEKVAFGWHLDGQCTAVIGTHTHVQTADERILPNGTAYITDAGMTGPINSVIGVERERAIRKFLTGIPTEFKVAKGPAMLCGVIIEADEQNGRALKIERVARLDTETQDEEDD
jgi:metallophosphoesterase (TIGR00282 family)